MALWICANKMLCYFVYNESKYEFIRSNRAWHLGNSQVEEGENYKHLGVINNTYLRFKPNIKDASDKLKGTFFSLINSGIFYENSFHPLTCKKIYNAVVIPRKLCMDAKIGLRWHQLNCLRWNEHIDFALSVCSLETCAPGLILPLVFWQCFHSRLK